MQTLVIAIHLIIVLILTIVVLIQRSEGGGLGIGGGGGGGGGGGFMSSRGTTNFLTRLTAVLAACFFVTSLLLSWLAADRKPTSILDSGSAPLSQSGAPAPQGSLLDSLKKPAAPAPAPAAPTGPQAPQSK